MTLNRIDKDMIDQTFVQTVEGHTSQLAENTHFINVKGKTYGAKGDGVTDDTPAIQGAIDYLSTNGGGFIYLPKGIYILKSPLLWKSNVSIFGDGVGLSILKPYEQSGTTEGFSAIEWVSGSTSYSNPMINCVFTNFEIDGSLMTISTYTSKPKGIVIHYMKDCIFKDMLIRNTCATGLGVDFLKNVTIDNVTTINCGRSWVDTGSEQNVGGAGIGIGTKRMQGESFIIRNCISDGNGNYGIFLEDQGFSSYPQNQDICYIISNNIVKNGRNIGIAVKGGDRTIISNNVVYNNAVSGIAVIENNGFTLDDCIISNNISQNNKRGIFVDCIGTVKNLKIFGNDVNRNIEQGILVTGDQTIISNMFIEDNNIYENQSGVDINLVLHSEFVKIKNNQIAGNYQNGLSITSLTNSFDTVTIIGNEVLNNNRSNLTDNTKNNGIYLDVISKNIKILDNIIGNTSSTLLYVRNQKNGLQLSINTVLTKAMISNNKITENVTANIIMTLSNFIDSTINGNLVGEYTELVKGYGSTIYDISLDMVLTLKGSFYYTITGAKVIDETLTAADDKVTNNIIFNPITKKYRQWNGVAWVNAYISNIIINGNFVNGTANWSTDKLTSFAVTNKEASFVASAQSGNIYQAPIGGSIVGNKYYIVAEVQTLSSSVSLGFGTYSVAHTGSGNYEKITFQYTAVGTGHAVNVKDNRTSGWDTVKVKNVMVIDLTTEFGTGNEPTKAWCDANIPFRP